MLAYSSKYLFAMNGWLVIAISGSLTVCYENLSSPTQRVAMVKSSYFRVQTRVPYDFPMVQREMGCMSSLGDGYGDA